MSALKGQQTLMVEVPIERFLLICFSHVHVFGIFGIFRIDNQMK